MTYVQIPANWFYLVLGIVIGVIATMCVLCILANRLEKKNREKAQQLFNNLMTLGNEEDKPKAKGRPRKIDK